MNRFQIPSPILDFQKTTLNPFILENVTMNPFDDFTTEQDSSESQENNGLFIIIYGIGGALIFFTIATICYGFCMPTISDAAYARFEERNRQNLRERIRQARLQRERNRIDVEDPVTPTQVLEMRPNETRDPTNLNRTQPIRIAEVSTEESPTTPQQSYQRPFAGVFRHIGSTLRSHTSPKQLSDSQQNTPQKNENHGTTLSEDKDEVPEFPISDKYEENVPSSEDVSDKCKSISPPDQFYQRKMLVNHDPCEEDSLRNIHDTTIYDSGLMPVSQEGRSQSSPTSPDILRRRFSSQDSTPRRSSSLR